MEVRPLQNSRLSEIQVMWNVKAPDQPSMMYPVPEMTLSSMPDKPHRGLEASSLEPRKQLPSGHS